MSRLLDFMQRDVHPDDVRMTLGEHLEELRSRVVRALVALAVGAILCYVFIEPIMGLLTSPVYAVYKRHGMTATMQMISPGEGIFTELKVSMILGVILSAPYSIWQLWGFIAAGLYRNERKWVYRFAPVSIALFFVGALFLFFIVSPLLLDFLLTYRPDYPNYDKAFSWLVGKSEPLETPSPNVQWPTTQPMPHFTEDPPKPPELMPWLNMESREIRVRIKDQVYVFGHLQPVTGTNRLDTTLRLADTIVFLLQLAAAFGVCFQVPVVVAFVATLGIATSAQIAGMRRYIWFGMCVMAAVITPTTDLVTLFLLLGPMVGLLEIGILAAKLVESRRGVRETSPDGGSQG
jgi:sec-independent protein translocase protein TatC